MQTSSFTLEIFGNSIRLGAIPRLMKSWQPIIEKFKEIIRYISFVARVSTPIKSSLSKLLIYYMSRFKLASKVVNEIVFYGGGDSDSKKKLHLVSWDKTVIKESNGACGDQKYQNSE